MTAPEESRQPRLGVLSVAAAVGAAVGAALTVVRQRTAPHARVPLRSPHDGRAWDTFEEAEAVKSVRYASLSLLRHITKWCSRSQGALPELPDAAGLAWAVSGEFKPSQIDERDVGTPDDWVPRHPELVRLTGATDRLPLFAPEHTP